MSKRRGNGEGNVRKRKDGRYEVSVMVGYHPDGRRKRKTLYGKTRREVVDKLHALQQEINMGMDLDVDYTFEQAADPCLIYHCMRSTLTCAYKNNVESIVIPFFGGGCGNLHPNIVAKMMWKAYVQIHNPPQKLDWDYAYSQEICDGY